ncbi:MAG: type II secretion system protein [Verrucomicrobiota bacterium]
MKKKTSNAQRSTFNVQRREAFTLIELLVVITIIVILMGLLFPAFRGVQDQAKRTQAKNDLAQIVTAVNAFYTEYGKYPLPTGATGDTIYGAATANVTLFNALRGLSPTDNPKQIAFISPPDVKDPAHPRSGIGGTANRPGEYFDPWGTPYLTEIDGDYEGKVANPYTAHAGSTPDLQTGIISWSLGKDQSGATAAAAGDKQSGAYDDDVISWQ